MKARQAEAVPTVLIIGIGDASRGDDGLGPAVLQSLRTADPGPVQHYLAVGDLSDLVLRWGAETDVAIVDAVSAGLEPGTIVHIDGLTEVLPAEEQAVSSHSIGLQPVIDLARLLDRLPRSLTIFGIQVSQTEVGSDLSPEVQASLDPLAQMIERWVDGRSQERYQAYSTSVSQ